MIGLATTIALIVLGIAMLFAVIRIIVGPTLGDRILGLDTITMLGIGIIGVFAVRAGQSLYIDIAVGLALVGFLSTVAFARYLLSRGKP